MDASSKQKTTGRALDEYASSAEARPLRIVHGHLRFCGSRYAVLRGVFPFVFLLPVIDCDCGSRYEEKDELRCIQLDLWNTRRYPMIDRVYWCGNWGPGSIAAGLVTPMDMLKTRLQKPDGIRDYKNMIYAYRMVVEKDGYAALYSGATPRMMVVGPLFGTHSFPLRR